jgi:DNA-binding response OmpR family regulator
MNVNERRMKSILVAEDEESLRVLVRATLDDPTYEIIEAADGDEALSMAREHRPDLLILDWMMPGHTGIEVTAKLRREQWALHTPIILLTAKSQQEDVASSYIVKPFGPVELLIKVQELLDQERDPIHA